MTTPTPAVTAEQAREALESLKLYEHGYTSSTPNYATVTRYVHESAARIAELEAALPPVPGKGE